jgi:cell division protein FtsQ
MKKIILIITGIIVIAGITALVVWMNMKHSATQCKQIIVKISNSNESYISTKEIKNYTLDSGKSLVIGKEISAVNIKKIENKISKNPYISEVEVFMTLDGILKINVQQRTPILRVFNAGGQSFYLDDKSVMMPSAKPARVLVANGNIHDIYIPSRKLFITENLKKDSINIVKQLINRLFILGQYISKDDFLKAFIQQIYVNDKEEFELIPLVGNYTIVLGDIDNMKEKFENLKIFYSKGLLNMGWDKYKTINLKFKNQIICNKN